MGVVCYSFWLCSCMYGFCRVSHCFTARVISSALFLMYVCVCTCFSQSSCSESVFPRVVSTFVYTWNVLLYLVLISCVVPLSTFVCFPLFVVVFVNRRTYLHKSGLTITR